jgi:hypothetical protein
VSATVRIQGFLERYRGGVARELALRVGLRAYRYPVVRGLAHRLLKPRTPRAWLFVVGCYNSGTTLTREILAAHPSVRTLPREGVRLTSVLPRPEDLGWTRMWIPCPEHLVMPGPDRPDLAARAIADWTPWWGRGGEVFVEKSISNVTRMEWLDHHFPGAYFLGITRDGYAVADGIRKRARPTGPVAHEFPDGYPLSLTARQWVDANERLLAGAKSVRRYHGIRYEDLATDPVAVLADVWRFLELAPPPTTFAGGVLTVGAQTFTVDNRSRAVVDRLSADDFRVMNPILREMQARLGYVVHDG